MGGDDAGCKVDAVDEMRSYCCYSTPAGLK